MFKILLGVVSIPAHFYGLPPPTYTVNFLDKATDLLAMAGGMVQQGRANLGFVGKHLRREHLKRGELAALFQFPFNKRSTQSTQCNETRKVRAEHPGARRGAQGQSVRL